MFGGRYYDNFFVKIAPRAPFPIVAVSARIPLPSQANVFEGHSIANTSISFVSGLADTRQDSSGILRGAPGAKSSEVPNKDYLLTYGVGNSESYATQMSQSEVDSLFAALDAVTADEVNRRIPEKAEPTESAIELKGSDVNARSCDIVRSPSKLVLDYQWQDEGSRVRQTIVFENFRDKSVASQLCCVAVVVGSHHLQCR